MPISLYIKLIPVLMMIPTSTSLPQVEPKDFTTKHSVTAFLFALRTNPPLASCFRLYVLFALLFLNTQSHQLKTDLRVTLTPLSVTNIKLNTNFGQLKLFRISQQQTILPLSPLSQAPSGYLSKRL